jgi:hypothetical protein
VRQLQDTDTMGVAGIAPLPRCAVKRSRAAPKRDAYLHCTTQSGQEGAPVCGSRPRPRLFFVASTSRTRQVGHDAPRRAAGGPVVRRGAACCPCWFTGTPSNRKRRAPALPMLRATRRARTMTRGGTSRGPRRGAARRELNHRGECCSWAPAKVPRMHGWAAAPNDIRLNMRWRAGARRVGGVGAHSDALWSGHSCRVCAYRAARRRCGRCPSI